MLVSWRVGALLRKSSCSDLKCTSKAQLVSSSTKMQHAAPLRQSVYSRSARLPAYRLGRGAVHFRAPRITHTSVTASTTEQPWWDQSRGTPRYQTVFTIEDWTEHRDPFRYFARLRCLPGSQVLRNVLPKLTWIAAVAIAIGAYSTAASALLLPEQLPQLPAVATVCSMAEKYVNYTSFAMSLMLTFHTNQSYARWSEARRSWGCIINRCRDLMRQCLTCFPDTDSSAQRAFARWLLAFSRSLQRRVQAHSGPALERDLAGVLPPAELEMLLSAENRPMKALHVLGELVSSVQLTPMLAAGMSYNLAALHDQAGHQERLLEAPIPESYTRHTQRFLFLWLSALPLALWPQLGWATLPLTALVGVALLSLDEIAVHVEEPFGILALDDINLQLEGNLAEMLADDRAVKFVAKRAVNFTAPSAVAAAAAAMGATPAAAPALVSVPGQGSNVQAVAGVPPLGPPAMITAASNAPAGDRLPAPALSPHTLPIPPAVLPAATQLAASHWRMGDRGHTMVNDISHTPPSHG